MRCDRVEAGYMSREYAAAAAAAITSRDDTEGIYCNEICDI